ncbi:MAG: replication-associated recombination protein A [Alphaproteobacteria bacterium]|nr:replication-associated recombination protein A [Alphaproteobacteria bacterium]
MESLFESINNKPLAERLRPKSLTDIVGQDHLLAQNGPIGQMIKANKITSMILWGPPGSGKTTLARLLAQQTNLYFEPISAVFSGVADLRKIFDQARQRRKVGEGTILFIDEIHRFNRAQQDSLLNHVEDGTVILIGATTENPSFEINAALLSRVQVFILNRLNGDALELILKHVELYIKRTLPLDEQARFWLKEISDGDGRYLLNLIETLLNLPTPSEPFNSEQLKDIIQRRLPIYDKDRESHYNLISALHKSLRGSDPDAALYWLARMLVGGEDPHYIARRLVRFATEDVGMADPHALTFTLNAWQTYERLGSPEGELALAQAVVYLGTSPKSNSVYTALAAAKKSAKETGSLTPPKHILNAPTKLMKDIGYGTNYHYDHNEEEAFSGQNYFPDNMKRIEFYQPSTRGLEKEINDRLNHWKTLRKKLNQT